MNSSSRSPSRNYMTAWMQHKLFWLQRNCKRQLRFVCASLRLTSVYGSNRPWWWRVMSRMETHALVRRSIVTLGPRLPHMYIRSFEQNNKRWCCNNPDVLNRHEDYMLNSSAGTRNEFILYSNIACSRIQAHIIPIQYRSFQSSFTEINGKITIFLLHIQILL